MSNILDVPQNFSTTLNVGGGIDNAQTSGIALTSVTGLPTDGGMLAFDWANPIVTSSIEYIEYGGLSSNTLTGVVRGQEGYSAVAHANGAKVVGVISRAHIKRLKDNFTAEHDRNTGQHKLANPILDSNGNPLIVPTATGSAVNGVGIVNAATGNPPTIKPDGASSDANVALKLTGKNANVMATGEYNNGSQKGTYNIDWTKGDRQLVTLDHTGNITFTYSGAVAGQSIVLRIVEDSTGGSTITLPTSKWPGGTVGTFTTTASAINLLVIYYDGTNYLTQLAAGFA